MKLIVSPNNSLHILQKRLDSLFPGEITLIAFDDISPPRFIYYGDGIWQFLK